jgi:hypothetical protein
MTEKLTAVAIIRDGVTESRGFKSHWELRYAMKDENPQKGLPGDIEGFITSTGRFVTRHEAKSIAAEAGQAQPTIRDLLSSDIDW